MNGEKIQIVVSSLESGGVIDTEKFFADVKELAAKRGLSESDIHLETPKNFPVDGATLVFLGLASKVAYDIWKEFILPELKEKYRIRQQAPGN